MGQSSRREFLKDATLAGVAVSGFSMLDVGMFAAEGQSSPGAAAAPGTVSLRWLGEKPSASATGVSFGVPWPKGALKAGSEFRLNHAGDELALQSWPLAYWPDGSLKWSGFATVVPPTISGPVTLSVGQAGTARGTVSVRNAGGTAVVDTGALKCSIPATGSNLFTSMEVGGKQIAGASRLVCILQNGPATNPEDAPVRESYTSDVKHMVVEQQGPVRAVVRVEGVHRGTKSGREWLPFTVRMYFYSGQATVRLVHTIVYDGDQEKDFVRGLGLEFDVPLRDEPQNRTVRFAGQDGGMWSEPLQPGGGSPAQENGQAFEPSAVFRKNAVWTDFRLTQANPDGFTIVKRTGPTVGWLFSAAGKRADGLASVGDLTGGLAVSIKNFWQSFPSGLEMRQVASPTAKLIAWLWSPDAPEMDMRFYDTHGHDLDAAYEDAQPGLSSAHGVARTSELTLYPLGAFASRSQSAAMAEDGKQRPLLAAAPEYIHSTGVFGVWSLPDRSTAFKKSIEDGLDSVLAFYQKQVDERSWYGYWQYGDFMHSYSAPRHVWHYDWGGHAWDNTELGAPLWLWYSFLRTGRADVFRLAEAHTRNTSETDTYHLGPMRGLGSRHNVVKWGDGAKEARISQAAHWRPFYYLTTDERAGDLMREAAEFSGVSIANFDPMREAAPPQPGEPKVRIRIGPDWFAMAGNWMTEWERTGDKKWRDHIVAGVDSIVAMPFGLETGKPVENAKAEAAIVAYDNATGKLTRIPDMKTGKFGVANYNLATIQGGAQVMFELVPLLARKDFETEWLRLCRLAVAPPEVWTKDKTTNSEGADAQYVAPGQGGSRLAAYAYAKTGNKAFLEKSLQMLAELGGGIANVRTVAGADSLGSVEEDPRMSTNDAAQTGLTCIEVLELCKDSLPTDALVRKVRQFRPRTPPGGAR